MPSLAVASFKGMYHDGEGLVYEGKFRRGEYHGFGICLNADGSGYEGDYCDGEPHGQVAIPPPSLEPPPPPEGTACTRLLFRRGGLLARWFLPCGLSLCSPRPPHTPPPAPASCAQGKWTFTGGATYAGGWDRGRQHGVGTYTRPDGSGWATRRNHPCPLRARPSARRGGLSWKGGALPSRAGSSCKQRSCPESPHPAHCAA